MMKKITIIGGGSWGTAIAQLLADNGHQVLLYLRDKKQKFNINQRRRNAKYFPQKELSKNITATLNLQEAVNLAEIIFFAVPTYATRKVAQAIRPFITDKKIIVSTAKGIEEDTFLRNSEIIKEVLDLPVVVLSGPTHAEEVIKGLPTAAVVASLCQNKAVEVQDLLMSASFRVYTNPDLVGVEFAGAIKNIIALAAGIADGLAYGDNTKAALVTRGLHEMSRLGYTMGGKLLTFAGLTGMGDLVVTCTSMHSRNRRFGIKIGEGLELSEAYKSINQVVEGVRTTRAVYEWFKKQKFDFEIPITREIYNVLFNNKDPLQAVDDLMLRGPKHEIEEVVQDLDW
nr:NAD(P)H-dependent glycerol-3-phosphate dehydrogenase [Halocella sp. SP3-1]